MIRQSQSYVGKPLNKLPREVFYRDLRIGVLMSPQTLPYMSDLPLPRCRTATREGGCR
jgi:hypothetical protein